MIVVSRLLWLVLPCRVWVARGCHYSCVSGSMQRGYYLCVCVLAKSQTLAAAAPQYRNSRQSGPYLFFGKNCFLKIGRLIAFLWGSKSWQISVEESSTCIFLCLMKRYFLCHQEKDGKFLSKNMCGFAYLFVVGEFWQYENFPQPTRPWQSSAGKTDNFLKLPQK